MSAELKARTKTFALDMVCFCADPPHLPESVFWLEFIKDLKIRRNLNFDARASEELDRLRDEACQLLAITIASRKTARENGAS